MSLSKGIRKFPLPDLYPTHFESKVSPFQKSPEVEEWLDWMLRVTAATEDESRSCKPIIAYMSHYYSNCVDITHYEVILKLFFSGTLWDDRAEADFKNTDYNEERALKMVRQLSNMLSKLENKEFVSMVDWDPTVIAIYGCLDNIYTEFNKTQKKSLISRWETHVLAMIEEYRLVAQIKSFPSVEEMIKVRVSSCGMLPFIQLIEYTDQIYLPEQIREDSRLLSLERLVAQHFSNVNDLISFEKDYNEGNGRLNTLNNCVAFFAIIKGLSIEDAMKELVEMVKQLEEDITRIESELLNEENCLDVTKKYINSLNNMVSANYKSMVASKRYQ